jgi:hypothetical protein
MLAFCGVGVGEEQRRNEAKGRAQSEVGMSSTLKRSAYFLAHFLAQLFLDVRKSRILETSLGGNRGQAAG